MATTAETITQKSYIDKLKTSVELIEAIKAENDMYKENFEQISENYEQLQEKNEEISKELFIASKERDSIKDDFENLKEVYKKRFSEQEKEIEQIKKQPPTQKAIELMKLEIANEIERSSAQRFDMSEKECAKFRSLYYKVKRESDTLQTESELKLNEKTRALEDLKRFHQEEILNFESKILILQQAADETSDIQRLRTCQREKTELELRVKSLLDELDEIRCEKENLRLSFEQEERNHKRQLADHLSISKTYHSEKESLKSKCYALEEESRLNLNKKAETQEENNRLRKELDKTIGMMEDMAHKLNVEISNSQMTILKQKSDYERQIEILNSKINSLSTEIKAEGALIQELRDKNSVQEREFLDRLRISKEEQWSKISLLETEKSNLEKQLVSIKQRSSEFETKSDAALQEQVKESTRIKTQLQNAMLVVEDLQEKNKTLAVDNDHSLTLLGQKKEQYEQAESALKDLHSLQEKSKHTILTLQEKISAYETSIEALENQKEHLAEQASRENEAYQHTLERQNAKSNQEKQNLIQKMELMTRDFKQLMERMELTENVLEREQNLYESKIAAVKEKMKQYKSESEQAKSLLESEKSKLDTKREEGQKRQQLFLQYLNQIAV